MIKDLRSTKKELENEIETKDNNYDERIDLEESFLEEIESFADEQDYIDIELMEEAKPDPQYFSDDDPVDMSDVDKIEKGIVVRNSKKNETNCNYVILVKCYNQVHIYGLRKSKRLVFKFKPCPTQNTS